jgi:hypothetical protein
VPRPTRPHLLTRAHVDRAFRDPVATLQRLSLAIRPRRPAAQRLFPGAGGHRPSTTCPPCRGPSGRPTDPVRSTQQHKRNVSFCPAARRRTSAGNRKCQLPNICRLATLTVLQSPTCSPSGRLPDGGYVNYKVVPGREEADVFCFREFCGDSDALCWLLRVRWWRVTHHADPSYPRLSG